MKPKRSFLFRVTKCSRCPYYDHEFEHVCTAMPGAMASKGKHIKNPYAATMPEWCPHAKEPTALEIFEYRRQQGR